MTLRSYSSNSNILNLAAYVPRTHALGPGERFAIWVQGCPFNCKGCIAPEWIPTDTTYSFTISEIAEKIIAEKRINGITISGGEPILQAGPLANLIERVRMQRNLDVIVFTGYSYEHLASSPPNPGVTRFLSLVDLLIDGPYLVKENDDLGLRGSRNQRFIHLTDRFANVDFINQPRKVEISVTGNSVFLVGVPPKGVLSAFDRAVSSLAPPQGGKYEWSQASSA